MCESGRCGTSPSRFVDSPVPVCPLSSDESSGFGPVFEEEPADTIYPEESPEAKIVMSCRARASPPAKYRWRLKGRDIDFKTESDHFSLVGGNLVISNPDKGKHVGTYSCVAANIFGAVVSRSALVQFGYLDMFSTEEREAVRVREGQGAVLLCDPPPHYPDDLSFRWMLNEFPVFISPTERMFVSQMTGNLYISKVEAIDSGNYSCFVSSPSIAKSVFSKFIPLVPLVEQDTFVVVKFSETYALVGQNITLECFALGNPIPQIKWRKVDGDLPLHHEISLAGGQLHLRNVQYEDEGTYECEALNSKGKDWHRANIHVEASPQWLEDISSTEKNIGSAYTMSCLASGKPKPHVHWLKNGQSVSVLGGGLISFISAATPALTSTRLCSASAPTFLLSPVKKKILVAKNGRVVIECRPRAAPKPVFTWSKGTELLANSSRIFIWESGNLEIVNATKTDEGMYTCFAENDLGKANSTGSLSITEATKITLAPSNADVTVGEDARMQCAASHDSTLDITFVWSLDGHTIDIDIEGEHYERVDGESSGEIVIKKTQLNHAGRYTCTAQTPVDNVTASADLVAPPAPPGGVRVEEIRDKSLRLIWSQGTDNHSPISKYSIQYRDSASTDDWREAVTSPVNVEGNAETATVVGLIPWTEYEFRVTATNTLGTGDPSDPSPKITTLEAAPVVAPSDIGGGGGSSRELTITWTPVQPEYYYGPNFGYIVAFKPHNENEWRKVTVAEPQARRYVHKDSSISPSTEFDVKVKAFNKKGEGPYSLTAVIYSAQDVPSEAPINLESRPLSATEVVLSWAPVLEPTVDGYQVRYWKKQVETESQHMPIMLSNRDNQTRIENLKPNSHYMMEVRAFNNAGLGPPKRIEISTKKPPPSRPPKIISTRLNPSGSTVNIAWEQVQPLANESKVENYKVSLASNLAPSNLLDQTFKNKNQHIDLPMRKGLHTVEVRAQTEGGDGAVAQVQISGKQSHTNVLSDFQHSVILFLLLFLFFVILWNARDCDFLFKFKSPFQMSYAYSQSRRGIRSLAWLLN
uniref:Contactin 1 n=1 Tax=Denticeps clupeoides TaxID=299321 RepID=A0AAY4DVU5_9TELE